MSDPIAQLESVELPALTPAARRAYSDFQSLRSADAWGLPRQFEQTPEDIALAQSILKVAIDVEAVLEPVRRIIEDTKQPIEVRERATSAYYRVAAFDALLGNELTEYQKTWPVKRLGVKGQPERIVAAWAASSDPHAVLVGELSRRVKGSHVDIAKLVGAICEGWTLQTPDDEGDYERSPKTIRKAIAELIGTKGVVDAVRAWLPTLAADDYERRVLHVGPVLAVEGSKASADALAEILATLDSVNDPARFGDGSTTPRTWAIAIWSKLAPAGSAVAARLGVTARPAKAANGATAVPAKAAKSAKAKVAKSAKAKVAKPTKSAKLAKAGKPAKATKAAKHS